MQLAGQLRQIFRSDNIVALPKVNCHYCRERILSNVPHLSSGIKCVNIHHGIQNIRMIFLAVVQRTHVHNYVIELGS